MATTSNAEATSNDDLLIGDLKKLLWGNSIKHDVFLRWTQGFEFSEDEPTALVQVAGGPCAIIAPVQAFLLKNMIFNYNKTSGWNSITDDQCDNYLLSALCDILKLSIGSNGFTLVIHDGEKESEVGEDANCSVSEDGESSPKKQKFSDEDFHQNLRCVKFSGEELQQQMLSMMPAYRRRYGVLLFLYSLVLTKGIEDVKNEMEDPSESLIDGLHGHGSQSLINLMLSGRAVSNVWDNDKEVTGLKLQGISQQATIGFLTLLEHLRYCEVGWYLKNPQYPVWLLGSETHLTVLFSIEHSLVGVETAEAAARRIFNSFDPEGCGFVSSSLLGDLLRSLDLVSEPEYVKIMLEKMDPEELGIVTLNGFMEEFFPNCSGVDTMASFTLYHYNGLKSSCLEQQVRYQEASVILLDAPEVQIITDTSPIKTCLMTKWPTIELTWKSDHIPSLN